MSQAPPFDWIAELQKRKVDSGIITLLGRCIAGRAERRPDNAADVAEQIEATLYRPLSDTNTSIVSLRNPSQDGETVTFTATVKAVAPDAGTPNPVTPPDKNQYYRFWERLLPRAATRTDLHKNSKPSNYNWISAQSGTLGVSFNYTSRGQD